MVYTAALLFGHGTPVPTEEESVIDMIGKYFLQLAAPGVGQGSATRRGSVESYEDTDPNSPYLEGFEEGERLLQQDVTRQMERCLAEAKASTLHCQMLLLPRQMTTRVSADVVRASADEPCGLRGAAIKLYMEVKDGLKSLGTVFPDPNVTPTFELSVVFKAERNGGWPPLKNIFESSKVLKLRPEYRLVKRKLYSSASPTIHEFN